MRTLRILLAAIALTAPATLTAAIQPAAAQSAEDSVVVDMSVLDDGGYGAGPGVPGMVGGLRIPGPRPPASQFHAPPGYAAAPSMEADETAPRPRIHLRQPTEAPAAPARMARRTAPAPTAMAAPQAAPQAAPKAAPAAARPTAPMAMTKRPEAPKPVAAMEKPALPAPAPAPAPKMEAKAEPKMEPKAAPKPEPKPAPKPMAAPAPKPAPMAKMADTAAAADKKVPPPAPAAPRPAAAPAPAQAAPAAAVARVDPGALRPGRVYQVTFDDEATKLPADAAPNLRAVVDGLKSNNNLRLQLMAYAGGAEMTPNNARRMSLRRALSVRSYLIDQGVRSTRIDVRALGNKTTEQPANRVDVMVVER